MSESGCRAMGITSFSRSAAGNLGGADGGGAGVEGGAAGVAAGVAACGLTEPVAGRGAGGAGVGATKTGGCWSAEAPKLESPTTANNNAM